MSQNENDVTTVLGKEIIRTLKRVRRNTKKQNKCETICILSFSVQPINPKKGRIERLRGKSWNS